MREGKQVGVSGFFFLGGEDCNETKAFIAERLYVERGLRHTVCDYLPAKPHSLY